MHHKQDCCAHETNSPTPAALASADIHRTVKFFAFPFLDVATDASDIQPPRLALAWLAQVVHHSSGPIEPPTNLILRI